MTVLYYKERIGDSAGNTENVHENIAHKTMFQNTVLCCFTGSSYYVRWDMKSRLPSVVRRFKPDIDCPVPEKDVGKNSL